MALRLVQSLRRLAQDSTKVNTSLWSSSAVNVVKASMLTFPG